MNKLESTNYEEYREAGGDMHSCKNQDICGKLVSREVGNCVSMLLDHFARHPEAIEGSDYTYEEDILPLCEILEYQEAAEAEGWEEFIDDPDDTYINLSDRQIVKVPTWRALCEEENLCEIDDKDEEDAEAEAYPEGWYRYDELTFYNDADCERSQVDSWEDLCDVENIEPYRNEVYEHWTVSDWFARKLRERGHPTGELFGLTIWGRCTTGQSILLDRVIGEIAAELQILEGQKCDWSTEQ